MESFLWSMVESDLPYGWWARGELDRLGCHRNERDMLWQKREHDKNLQ